MLGWVGRAWLPPGGKTCSRGRATGVALHTHGGCVVPLPRRRSSLRRTTIVAACSAALAALPATIPPAAAASHHEGAHPVRHVAPLPRPVLHRLAVQARQLHHLHPRL